MYPPKRPPSQYRACGGVPLASHSVSSLLILLYKLKQKPPRAVPYLLLFLSSRSLQWSLKQEQGSLKRQPPMGPSIETFKLRWGGTKQYLHPPLLTLQAALNSSSHRGYFGSLKIRNTSYRSVSRSSSLCLSLSAPPPSLSASQLV